MVDILISHFANKTGFDLALCNFSPKIIMISKKKRSSLRIDLLFPYFPHKIMVISKKKSSLRMELRFIYFRRQLQVFSKKKRSALRIKFQFVCSEAPHSQFGEGARPHLCMDEWNRPTPVRRRLSLTQAARGKPIPTGLAPAPGTKARSMEAFSQYSVFHL